MAISTNQKPTIYRNLYENTSPGELTYLDVIWITRDPIPWWQLQYVCRRWLANVNSCHICHNQHALQLNIPCRLGTFFLELDVHVSRDNPLMPTESSSHQPFPTHSVAISFFQSFDLQNQRIVSWYFSFTWSWQMIQMMTNVSIYQKIDNLSNWKRLF